MVLFYKRAGENGPLPRSASGNAKAAKRPGGRRLKPRWIPAGEEHPRRVFRQQRGVLLATTPLSMKIWWQRPDMGRILKGVIDSLDLKHIGSNIKIRLRTIHPNPGPRNKTEEGKDERRKRRKEKRKETRQQQYKNKRIQHHIMKCTKQ